jgi:hypothetical protein
MLRALMTKKKDNHQQATNRKEQEREWQMCGLVITEFGM